MQKTLVVTAVCGMSSVALGSEGGANNPFAGDIGVALWTLVIFVAVLIVLGKFAWGPILNGLQSREKFIRDSLQRAKEDREMAESTLKEYTERLEAARAEATAIVDEGRRDAEVVKGKITEEAKAQADQLVARAKREIAIATEAAISDLYATSSRLATDVAGRVLKREIDQGTHEQLIRESIEEFSRVQQN